MPPRAHGDEDSLEEQAALALRRGQRGVGEQRGELAAKLAHAGRVTGGAAGAAGAARFEGSNEVFADSVSVASVTSTIVNTAAAPAPRESAAYHPCARPLLTLSRVGVSVPGWGVRSRGEKGWPWVSVPGWGGERPG